MKNRHKEVVLALAENGMKPTQAAEAMFSHRNTVLYYIKQIKEETGLDPLKFYDLCKLVEIVREEE